MELGNHPAYLLPLGHSSCRAALPVHWKILQWFVSVHVHIPFQQRVSLRALHPFPVHSFEDCLHGMSQEKN